MRTLELGDRLTLPALRSRNPYILKNVAKWHDRQAKRKRKNEAEAARHKSIAKALRQEAKELRA